MAEKAKESRSTPRTQIPARLATPTYNALASASSDLGQSMNSVLNRAVEFYVEQGGLRADLEKARARQDEAIRKLSGG